jgi:transposase-like protein
MEGKNYQQIAKECGVANKGAAYKMVTRALKSAPTPQTQVQRFLYHQRFTFLLEEFGRRLGWIPFFEEWCWEEEPKNEWLDVIDDVLAWWDRHEGTPWPGRAAADRVSQSRPMSSEPSETPARVVRDAQARSLRQQGHTFDQIARKLGVANRSVAAKMVRRAERRADEEVVEAYRTTHAARLLTIELALFERLMLDELSDRQFSRILGGYHKVCDQRCRFLGLYPKPDKMPFDEPAGELQCDDDTGLEWDETLRILCAWRYLHPDPSPFLEAPPVGQPGSPDADARLSMCADQEEDGHEFSNAAIDCLGQFVRMLKPWGLD